MSLQSLDRTQWSHAEALAHVETVTVARRADEAAKAPPKPEPAYQHWNRSQDPTVAWKAEAANELLVALRDGDLIAQGRYTEERTGWAQGDFSGFGLHSGYHTSIRPEQWREGRYSFGRLTARDWEFIDIRMPRFLVKAIWPDYVPEIGRPAARADAQPYTTPYLALMQAAIGRFGITAETQGKKEGVPRRLVPGAADRGRAGVEQARRRHGHSDPAALGAARRREAGVGPGSAPDGLRPPRDGASSIAQDVLASRSRGG